MSENRSYCPKCGSPIIERYTDRSGPDLWHCHGCGHWFDSPSAFPDEQGREDPDEWESDEVDLTRLDDRGEWLE